MVNVEKYQYAGMTVEIEYDAIPEHANPRDCDCNLGVMLCGHSRYTLGDEQVSGDDFTTSVACPNCAGTGENTAARDTLMVEICDCPRCQGSGEIELSLAAYLTQERGASVILPLGLIDHSGISMYVGHGAHPHDPGGWDSGQVGVIFDTTETRKECGLQDAGREEIEKALRAEVQVYAQYLRGEVYSYCVTDPDGEHIDSCHGLLGDLEYVRSQANEAAEHGADAARREQEERHVMACRDIVTA
jgi:hypothetical protein